MEHGDVSDGLCDHRLLAESPATPTHSSTSFPPPRRARERVVDSSPIQFPITGTQGRSGSLSQPTQPQERALLSLARFSPWKVTAWVEILQSLEPGYQHIGSLAPLTPLELRAVHELKDCEQDWLLAWLKIIAQYRLRQPSSTPRISPLQPIATPRGYSPAFQSALSTPARTSASSLHPSSAFSLRNVQSALPSTLSSATSRSQPSVVDQESPTSSRTGDHLHWCNICENPREFKTCDGYKRHMREHETIYRCMPDGPIKFTEAGAECYFCGASTPDKTHLDTHDVAKCYGQYANRQSYTRRVNLRNHNKGVHKCSDDYASALAEAWGDSHKNKRKFYSCGFCICYFTTLIEKSKHIDMEHWKQHQDLKEWDDNKVILGLLLQPGVKEAWHQLLILAGIDPEFNPAFNPDFNLAPQWPPSLVEQVQLQLEIGEGPPAALAELAFQKSSFDSVYEAMVSNGILQPSNWNMEISSHPSIQQNTISMTQLRDEGSLQISSDSPLVDNSLHDSHRDRANSYHENAPGFAQTLLEVEHGQFQSNIGSYEATGMDAQQNVGYHDHSNPVDPHPQWGTTGTVVDWESLSPPPWSAYTVSQRPVLAQDSVFSEESSGVQASFDHGIGGMDIDSTAEQPETYLPHNDSTIMEGLSSLVNEATPRIPNPLPARRRSPRPIVIGGSKRKLSSSQPRESRYDREANPIVVEMGRASVRDDLFRSTKRIEGYNNHD